PCGSDFAKGDRLPALRKSHCNFLGVCYNAPSIDAFPKRLFGTHYCGPGGAGPALGGNDPGCKVHDECYAAHDLTSMSNWNPLLPSYKEEQLQQCNQQLCDAANSNPSATGSSRID